MNRIILTIFLCSLAASGLNAQEIKFSSSYTDLAHDCRWTYKARELVEGQDNALTCKGYGKFKLYIYFSAMNTLLTIKKKDDPEYSFLPAIYIPEHKKGKVEWRMANNVPFAVIVRSKKLSETDGSKEPETLQIRGLKGFESIDFSVETKDNAGANEKARALADEEYLKWKKQQK